MDTISLLKASDIASDWAPNRIAEACAFSCTSRNDERLARTLKLPMAGSSPALLQGPRRFGQRAFDRWNQQGCGVDSVFDSALNIIRQRLLRRLPDYRSRNLRFQAGKFQSVSAPERMKGRDHALESGQGPLQLLCLLTHATQDLIALVGLRHHLHGTVKCVGKRPGGRLPLLPREQVCQSRQSRRDQFHGANKLSQFSDRCLRKSCSVLWLRRSRSPITRASVRASP